MSIYIYIYSNEYSSWCSDPVSMIFPYVSNQLARNDGD